MQQKKLITISKAAKLLDVSPSHVRRMIADGDIPTVRLGRLVRVDMDDIEELIEKRKRIV